MGVPPAYQEKLEQLKEEFRGRASQDWRARWWARLTLEQRRTLAVLSGVDDDERTVCRGWLSISADNRAALVATGREWARLLEPVRYG